jgi:hypothetical protein
MPRHDSGKPAGAKMAGRARRSAWVSRVGVLGVVRPFDLTGDVAPPQSVNLYPPGFNPDKELPPLANKAILPYEVGGDIVAHNARFRLLTAAGNRSKSAAAAPRLAPWCCPTPKERLCIGYDTVFGFHQARSSIDGTPFPPATKAMFESNPPTSAAGARGGIEQMPTCGKKWAIAGAPTDRPGGPRVDADLP